MKKRIMKMAVALLTCVSVLGMTSVSTLAWMVEKGNEEQLKEVYELCPDGYEVVKLTMVSCDLIQKKEYEHYDYKKIGEPEIPSEDFIYSAPPSDGMPGWEDPSVEEPEEPVILAEDPNGPIYVDVPGPTDIAMIIYPSVAEVALLGDLDGDGSVTLSDAASALQLALGMEAADEARSHMADLNGNNAVDMEDVTLTLKLALGMR